MSASFKLDAAQQRAVDTMAADTGPGALLQGEIGSGKTAMAVETILDRYATRTLIVAPLPVYESWRDTLLDRTEGLARLRVCAKKMSADTTAREANANLEKYFAGEDGFYFMGREFWIAQDWETSEKVDSRGRRRRVRKGVYNKRPVEVLVFDEAHAASSRDSRGYKTFKYTKAQYKIAATGTFFGNKFENAYTLPNAIWGDDTTDTFALWRQEYCTTKYTPHTYDHVEVTGEKEAGVWVKAIPTYIFIPGHKGEISHEPRFVDLHPSQRRMYDALNKEYAAKAASGEWILPELAIEARTRLRQVSLADIDIRPAIKKDGSPVYDDKGRQKMDVFYPEDGKSAYYDELKRMLREDDEPVVITSDFAKFAEVLTKWLVRDGFSAGLWAGKTHTSDTERVELKRSFMAGQTRIIVGVPAAMGTGVDGLQSVCHIMHISSEDQSEFTSTQLVGRLNRRGQTKTVRVIRIHARGTLDEDISNGLAMRAIDNAISRELDAAEATA